MNIVDSSGWLAYFADEPNAKHFLIPLKDTASLVVLVLCDINSCSFKTPPSPHSSPPRGEEVVNSKKFPLPNGERVRVRGNWAKTNVTEH